MVVNGIGEPDLTPCCREFECASKADCGVAKHASMLQAKETRWHS